MKLRAGRPILCSSILVVMAIFPFACTRPLPNAPGSANTPTPTGTSTLTPTITGTPNSIATAIAGAPDLNLSAGTTTLNTGLHYFNCVNIGPGGVVTINGAVTIFAKCFNLASGATLTGKGKGYGVPSNNGPGMGGPGMMFAINGGVTVGTIRFGAGGGHGGNGASSTFTGCYDQGSGVTYCYVPAQGGSANDSTLLPALMGSAGFNNSWNLNPSYIDCGRGGGLLKLVVYDPGPGSLAPASIDGTIDMGGYSGCNQLFYHDGGGAGGAILIESSALIGSGALLADGGPGDTGGGGGGGGGGIISLIADTSNFSGTTSVSPGTGWLGSQPGVLTLTAPPTSGYW